MKEYSSTGLWALVLVSVLHISTFIAWNVYQEQRLNGISGLAQTNKGKLDEIQLVRELVAAMGISKATKTRRDRRDVKDNKFIQKLLETQRDHFVEVYLRKVEQHTNEIFQEYARFLNPNDGSVRMERAATTSSPTSGNEMAQIFQQLANSELAIFNKYCGKNSTICLPGPKGEPGLKGDVGLQGLRGNPGVAGQKGDVGIPGIMGPKGEPGIIGAPGQKGSKGETGSSGTPGPAGIKGSKGEMGLPGSIGFPGQKGDRGARGESGPAGVPGIKGEKGDRGNIGPQGIKGEIGQQGPQGNPGIQGSRGDKGQKGDNGEVRDLRPTTLCCDLLERPTFNKSEETIKALEGTKVTLTCNPHGHPKPTVSWSPDPSADNSGTVLQVGKDLQLSNLDVSQTGKYVCTADSALGTTTKTYNLEVYKHIKFVGGLSNHTLLEGQNVFFECKFSGNPEPKISWYRNNPDGTRTEITTGVVAIPGGSQLELQRVSNLDKGEYTCEADNGLETLAKHAFLSTQGPPTIVPQPTVTGLVGQTLTLQCNAQGDPKPTTTWSSPPNVNNAYENKDGNLVLMNVQTGDAGPYVCRATNALGSTSSTVNLVVKAPGHVEIAGRVNSVTNNTRTVGLDCTATGEQPLTVQWYRNGIPVVPDQNHVILPGNTLLILNVKQPDDLGQYMCVASNVYGSDNKTALIYDDRGTKTCRDTFGDCQVICGATCPAGCFSVGYTGTLTYDSSEPLCDSAIKSGAIKPSGGTVVWNSVGNKNTILVT